MRAIALVLILLSPPCLAADWLEHRPSGGQYRVEMPGTPKITTMEVKARLGTSQLVMSMLEVGEATAFAVSFSDLPERVLKERTLDQMLDDSRDGIAGT